MVYKYILKFWNYAFVALIASAVFLFLSDQFIISNIFVLVFFSVIIAGIISEFINPLKGARVVK